MFLLSTAWEEGGTSKCGLPIRPVLHFILSLTPLWCDDTIEYDGLRPFGVGVESYINV